MAHGLQVYNSSGGIVHDISDRLTRYIGNAVISGSGSFQVPDFALGAGWYFTTPLINFGTSFSSLPEITISGTTLSWTTDSASSTAPVTVHYGVY